MFGLYTKIFMLRYQLAGFRGTTIRGLNEKVHDHNDKKILLPYKLKILISFSKILKIIKILIIWHLGFNNLELAFLEMGNIEFIILRIPVVRLTTVNL